MRAKEITPFKGTAYREGWLSAQHKGWLIARDVRAPWTWEIQGARKLEIEPTTL